MENSTEKELLLKLHDKVDTIRDKISDIEIVQVKHEANLQEHMKRSDMAEERIEFIESEVKPLLQGLSFLKIIAKVATTIGSIIYGVSRFFL